MSSSPHCNIFSEGSRSLGTSAHTPLAAKANMDPGSVDPIKAVAITIAANILRPRVCRTSAYVCSIRFEQPNIRLDGPQLSNCNKVWGETDRVCNQNRNDLPDVSRLLAFRSPHDTVSGPIVFRI